MRESILVFAGYCVLLFTMLFFAGCSGSLGEGEKEDDTQESTSSESNVDIVDCSGATFDGLDAEEVAELVEAADEQDEIVVEEEDFQFGGQTRTFKVSIIQGCGNTVVSEDNDSLSDDDTNVDFGSSEDAEGVA